MALLPDSIDFDPGLEANLENRALVNGMPHCNADTIRLWAKHFTPLGASDGLLVPKSWCDFITIMLLSPDRFDWTKSFLGSKAWNMIQMDMGTEAMIAFSLPQHCPIKHKFSCSNAPAIEIPGQDFQERTFHEEMADIRGTEIATPDKQMITSKNSISTSLAYLKRKQAKAPLVVTDVRRSDRLKGKTHGFKAETCISKNCLCCSAVPPTLSSKIIRSLGSEFYKIPPRVLSEDALQHILAQEKKEIFKKGRAGTPSKDPDADKLKKKTCKDYRLSKTSVSPHSSSSIFCLE
jgi:hypothetical protein